MKKKVGFFLLTLCFSFAFLIGISRYFQFAAPQTMPGDKIAAENKAAASDQGSKMVSNIHPILGSSNRLTEKQRTAMEDWRKEIVKLAAADPEKIFINGFTTEKKVALTFDDGPDGQITPGILDVLKENHVKASFFFMGKNLAEHPDVVKRADREGHLVLSHTWSHQRLTRKSTADTGDEIGRTEEKIDAITGNKPAFIRPPYGDLDEKTAAVIKENGCRIVLWSIDTLDWSQMEKGNIIKNVTDNVRPGDIILMHSNQDKFATLRALPELIAKLQEMGYSFVDLGELLQVDPYK